VGVGLCEVDAARG